MNERLGKIQAHAAAEVSAGRQVELLLANNTLFHTIVCAWSWHVSVVAWIGLCIYEVVVASKRGDLRSPLKYNTST